MVKLVIDMMGGDNGIKATIGGVKKFLLTHDDVQLVLVGDENKLSEFKDRCEIIHSTEVLPMECHAMEAMRRKESSVYKVVDYAKNGGADGIISAGSTGAFLSLATLIIKRINGVSRPALITPFPTKIENKYAVLLDVGASSENNAQELFQFAKMGEAYYRVVFGKESPVIYLLSNGSEEGKGNSLTKEAYELLKNGNSNFKGYIEGRYVFDGNVDVVVMDGFTGNIFLKTAEGVAKMMSGLIKDAFTSSFSSKIGYLFAKKGFKKMSSTMDYKKVGGALLLGVNTVAVKAHGNSNEDSFFHSIELCYNLAKQDVVHRIEKSLLGE